MSTTCWFLDSIIHNSPCSSSTYNGDCSYAEVKVNKSNLKDKGFVWLCSRILFSVNDSSSFYNPRYSKNLIVFVKFSSVTESMSILTNKLQSSYACEFRSSINFYRSKEDFLSLVNWLILTNLSHWDSNLPNYKYKNSPLFLSKLA